MSYPPLPRPVPEVDSPEYQAWRVAFQEYIDTKNLSEACSTTADFKARPTMVPSPRGFQLHRKKRGQDADDTDD